MFQSLYKEYLNNGTSEGVKKAWLTRKQGMPEQPDHESYHSEFKPHAGMTPQAGINRRQANHKAEVATESAKRFQQEKVEPGIIKHAHIDAAEKHYEASKHMRTKPLQTYHEQMSSYHNEQASKYGG